MQFPLDLTENHVRKLVKGYPIQLTNKHLNGNNNHLMLHQLNHKKLSQAKAKGKGVRLTLSQPELKDTVSSGGFGDWFNKLKNVGQWVSKHIIQTPFYQSAVRPVLHGLAETAVNAAAPMLGPAAPIAKAGVEKLGDVTQAFGLEKPKAKRTPKPRAKENVTKSHSKKGGSFMI